eukprot:scaffold8779_cov104-Isochrysis_galbana.AAC.1
MRSSSPPGPPAWLQPCPHYTRIGCSARSMAVLFFFWSGLGLRLRSAGERGTMRSLGDSSAGAASTNETETPSFPPTERKNWVSIDRTLRPTALRPTAATPRTWSTEIVSPSRSRFTERRLVFAGEGDVRDPPPVEVLDVRTADVTTELAAPTIRAELEIRHRLLWQETGESAVDVLEKTRYPIGGGGRGARGAASAFNQDGRNPDHRGSRGTSTTSFGASSSAANDLRRGVPRDGLLDRSVLSSTLSSVTPPTPAALPSSASEKPSLRPTEIKN